MAYPYRKLIKPPLGSRPYKGHRLSRGLVGFWLMNEGSGNKVFDLSGNRNHGTLIGTAPSWSPGNFGTSVYLPGTDEYINCGPSANAVDSQPGLTVIAWVQTTQASSGREFIVSKYGGVGDDVFELEWDTGEDIKIFVRNAAQDYAVGEYVGTFLTDGLWHQLVGTYDGANVRVYVDSVVGGTVGSLTGLTGSNATSNLTLGAVRDGAGYFFDGIIDHVMIYNRALSASEIALLYREPFCMFKDPAEIALLGGYQSVGGEEFIRTFEDGIGILDTMGRTQVQLRTIADGIGTLDDAGRTQVQLRAVADSLGIIDALWKGETRIFADVLEITDAVTRSQVLARTITDDVGLVDGVDRLMTYARILAETLGLSDALWKADAKIVSDDIGISDSVARIQAQARIIADAMGITDDVTRLQVQLRTIADTLDLTDLMTPGQVITFAEAMGISDSITRTQVQIRTVADSLGITDDLTRIAAYVFTQTDDIGIADAMIRVAVKLRTISDDIGMTDARDVSHIVAGLFKAAWAFMILRQEQ